MWSNTFSEVRSSSYSSTLYPLIPTYLLPSLKKVGLHHHHSLNSKGQWWWPLSLRERLCRAVGAALLFSPTIPGLFMVPKSFVTSYSGLKPQISISMGKDMILLGFQWSFLLSAPLYKMPVPLPLVLSQTKHCIAEIRVLSNWLLVYLM